MGLVDEQRASRRAVERVVLQDSLRDGYANRRDPGGVRDCAAGARGAAPGLLAPPPVRCMVSFARAVHYARLHRVDDAVTMAYRDLRLYRDGDGVEHAAACDLPSAAVLDRASAGDAAAGPYWMNLLRYLPVSRAAGGW